MVGRVGIMFALLVPWIASIPPASAMSYEWQSFREETVWAQGESDAPQAFVSGSWRITVVDAIQSPAIEGISNGGALGNEWAVVVADVANFSEEPASINLADFSLVSAASTGQKEQAVAIADVNLRAGPGTDTAILNAILEGSTVTLLGEAQNGFLSVESAGQQGWIFADFLSVGGSVASGAGPASVDLAASQAAANALDFESSEEFSIDPADVQRVVAAFPIPVGTQDYSLALGDESLPIVASQRAALDPDDLPELTEDAALVDVASVNVTGSRTIEFQENGTTTEAQLFGIDTPTGGECFGDEAEAELSALVGSEIFVEPAGDGYLVWTRDDTSEAPTLVNYALVEGGFAASEQGDGVSPFSRWIATADEQAQAEERGLWGACTGVHGTEKPQPTPTPVPTPSAAELRAEYPVLADVRELAIRPGNLLGEKVAFTGDILSINVATPGNAFFLGESENVVAAAVMQIWVTAPDGTREPIFVAYDGDTTGMFEGTFLTVYGTVVGTQSGTNTFGGSINQPLVKADIIDFA